MAKEEQCEDKPREDFRWCEVGVLEGLIENDSEENEGCVTYLEREKGGEGSRNRHVQVLGDHNWTSICDHGARATYCSVSPKTPS